ncbi:Thiol-disulfide isomerase or thioredoxin [Chitinophaga sp. CF118]|uniref:TlpA family protein disulfide reductase n=1 Tax=Chitinophaga sp. CF118 TaxID=1884367 RepID=UPI0008EA21DE|nr:redoxin family protein [Chitinophaga sp. CF118]SFD22648.1 Thiol-disulfide isomerase or thioredoxin [Chitinophaga sp. CF118]
MSYSLKISRTLGLTFLSILCFMLVSLGQERAKLFVGDKAPELRYGKWLKGSPIKQYEKGRLYLFEFWATWCGPCIASMPHLSEFARERKQDATVIAVNIWEKTGDKPYESSLPKVSKFVKGMGNKMDFNVITDSKDQFMGKEWMEAAGQDGIPCSFMVKDGIILWMGHPIELDSVVKVVMSGNYDVAATKKKLQEKTEQADSAMVPFQNLYKAYEKAIADKQFARAYQLLDSGIAVMPNFAGTFGFFKFNTMIEYGSEDTAMAFVRPWQATKPGYVGSTAAVIARKKGLKKSTYEYALELLNAQLEVPQMPPSIVYEEMAGAYANMNDYKSAVQYEEKAITTARQLLKEGKFAGFIMEDTIKESEKKLAGYKKELK